MGTAPACTAGQATITVRPPRGLVPKGATIAPEASFATSSATQASAKAPTTVDGSADLSILKSGHIVPPVKGVEVTYTLRASYAAAMDATGKYTGVPAVGHVNAHATSTPAGDVTEAHGIRELLGDDADHIVVTGTKSMTGHLLGAAGALETMATLLALHERIVPPTINHASDDEDPEIDYKLNFTFNKAQHRPIRAALSNTFGFGGHNASVIFKKFVK